MVTIEEANERLIELVRTTPIGQKVILLQYGRPVSYPSHNPPIRRGFARGRVISMAPDIDETPSDFGDYIA